MSISGNVGGNVVTTPTFWQWLRNFTWNHRAKLTVIGMIAFSTFVHSLPVMIHSSHGFIVWLYNWFYTFIHALAGGLGHPINGADPW